MLLHRRLQHNACGPASLAVLLAVCTHAACRHLCAPVPQVRDFHACIGKETRRQALEKWGGLPDIMVACVGGGSNAMGLFHEFVEDESVRLIGVEAGESQRGAAASRAGPPCKSVRRCPGSATCDAGTAGA